MRQSPFPSCLLLIALLFLQVLNSSSNGCTTTLISGTQSTVCFAPSLFYPVPLLSAFKKIIISLTMIPKSSCDASGNGVFFSLSILPPGATVRKEIMHIAYSSNTISFQTEDTNGLQSVFQVAMSSLINQPIIIAMTADLSSTGQSAECSLQALNTFSTPGAKTGLSYGSDWVFDSSTLISVCSNPDGTNQFQCDAQNFKFSSLVPAQFPILSLSNNPVLRGDYKLEEGTGTSAASSQADLGLATLSFISPPEWNTGYGLQFDGITNQYIQLPGLTPWAQDSATTVSIAFAFFLKIDQAPPMASYPTIFTYYCQTYGNNILSLALTPSMAIRVQIPGLIAQSSVTLTPGKWTTIYAAYILTAGGYGVTRVFVNGVHAVDAVTQSAPPSTIFSLSDTVRIGGPFVGYLRRFQVYSTAALELVQGSELCDSSTCSVGTGLSNPQVCLQTVCSTPGTYSSFGTCEQCPSYCLTCSDPGTCLSCQDGLYLSGANCLNCPMHCVSCIDSQTCKTCSPGYALYNNLCVLCPAGTYLTSNQICQQISQTLQDTLKTSQSVSSAATQIANIISKGSSISLSAAVSGKIFSQIKYLNISYSGELQIALLTWLPSFVSLGLTPNMPQSMIDRIPERHVPYVFGKYDVPSSFLENFWENLGVIVFAVAIWMLLKGLESIKSQIRKIRVLIQNFLITALYGVYGDLVLYSVVEYRTFALGWNLSLLSFLVSIILLAIMFITFWYQTKILLDYQRIKKQGEGNLEKFTKSHEGSQVFFKDFKDYSLSPQLFLFFLSGRDLLFSLVLATMFDYPLPQTILSTISSCLMIVYLFLKKPFENTFDFIQQLFFEFIGLIVTVSVLVNAVLDAGKYEAPQARENIGTLVIIANLIFNFVTAVFMIICIVQASREFYREHQKKQAKKFKSLSLNNRLQGLSASKKSQDPLALKQTGHLNVISESLTSHQILETSSFQQQESFDLALLPQSMPNPRKNQKRRNLLNPPHHEPSSNLAAPIARYNQIHSRKKGNVMNSSASQSQSLQSNQQKPKRILRPDPVLETRPRR